MGRIVWDGSGEREYNLGVSHGVLYPLNGSTGKYEKGVAWNGLTGVDENPDGGDINDIWADNIKYATFQTPENNKGSITALMFPPEFYPCLGMVVPEGMEGLAIGGQPHKAFGFVYRTELGTDTNEAAGYVLHIIWNCKVQPSSKSHATKNENPDPEEMSWDYSATPVNVTGVTGVTTTSYVEIKSTLFTKAQMDALEAVLFGVDAVAAVEADVSNNIPAVAAVEASDPTLPEDPGEIYDILAEAAA